MIKLAVALYALSALISMAMGARYFGRTDSLPYQAEAVGKGVAIERGRQAGLRT